jgi:CDP-4-dehydro-6-deoxyglucose reductase
MAALEYFCTVKKFEMLTPTVFELYFETNAPFQFEAGQFISVIVPGAGPNGRDLRRAYSIASAPQVRPVELCVKLVEEGPGTNYLYGLRPGDTFKGLAPYGHFVFKPKAGRHVCFIATGTGIAPFRAMADSESFRAHPHASILCLLGVRTEDELLYLDTMAKRPDIQWVSAVSQPQSPVWTGFKGRVTDYLRAQGDSFPWKDTEFYLCGNGQMITEMKALFTERGVDKDAIHQEKYY